MKNATLRTQLRVNAMFMDPTEFAQAMQDLSDADAFLGVGAAEAKGRLTDAAREEAGEPRKGAKPAAGGLTPEQLQALAESIGQRLGD